MRVVDKFLMQLEAQLHEKKSMRYSPTRCANTSPSTGSDPLMGARPMSRLIQDTIRRGASAVVIAWLFAARQRRQGHGGTSTTGKITLIGERAANRVLDESRHRAGAHERIEPVLGEVFAQRVGEYRIDFFLVQLRLELHQELVHHAHDDVMIERSERYGRVEAVAKLR